MDWFAWLSKTSFEPSLVYEYGLMFSHNELEEEDIMHFTHDFLQSMGISIAKHSIEILKLAKRRSPSFSKLLASIKSTKKYVSKHLLSWLSHQDSALSIVPRTSNERSWKMRKARKLMLSSMKPLLLTNGRSNSTSKFMKVGPAIPENDSSSTSKREHIRWASMFQDLKPT